MRENAWQVGPRIGFSYMLTADAKNIVRGSYVRRARADDGPRCGDHLRRRRHRQPADIYDNDWTGRRVEWESAARSVARTASLAPYEFDPNVHQPYVDEFIFGFRKQFAGPVERGRRVDEAQLSGHVRAAGHQRASSRAGRTRRLAGSASSIPNRGVVYQQTNNTWSTLEWQAIEVTVAKNLSNNFQAAHRHQPPVAGVRRHVESDRSGAVHPARRVSRATSCSTCRGATTRRTACQSTTGTTVHTYGPTWQKYSLRFGGTYHAPWGVIAAASYTILAGPWTGPIVDQLPVSDPQLAVFGPSTLRRWPTGRRPAIRCSTRMRFVFPTRGEGQVQAPAIKTLGLKIGKLINLGRGTCRWSSAATSSTC